MQNYFKGYAIRAGVMGGIVAIVILLFALIPVLGRFIGLMAWGVYLGTGVLAAHWGKTWDGSHTIHQSGMDGAFAGGIAGGVSHVVKFLAQIVLLAFLGTRFGEALGRTGGLLMLGAECLIAGLGIVIAVILAAAGAMVYTGVSQAQNKSGAS